MVHGIAHFSMHAPAQADMDAAIAFYTEVLGGQIAYTWANGCLLSLGTAQVEIFLAGVVTREKGAIRHVALSVDDVDVLAQRIADAGYPLTIAPKTIDFDATPPLRARVAFCQGALGEEIELFCPET